MNTKVLSLLFAALLSATSVRAGTLFTLNTSGLTGPGPWSIGLQFVDGGVLNNNTATLTNFALAGGVPGAVQTAIGVTGDISSSVTFDNSVFFGQFIQDFTPGGTLSFQLALTNNFDGAMPDQFSVQLFNNGNQIQTEDPGGSVMYVDLTGSTPVYFTFASDPTSGYTIAAPTVTITAVPPPTGVPEPGGLFTLGLALLGAGKLLRRRNPQP